MRVTLGGEPLEGAWVDVRLPMTRKNDYNLMFGPTDRTGTLAISRADLANHVHVVQLSGLMDYMGLSMWTGELMLTPFNGKAIRQAEDGHRVWARALPEAYPSDFLAQMASLARRLEQQPDSLLEVSGSVRGGTARLTSIPATT